jgi:hypothetical protein
MITFIGIVFLIFPLFLIYLFEDKLRAFLYIFLSEIAIILFLSIFLQYFGIFTYKNIFGLNLILSLLLIIFLIKSKKFYFNFKINWFLILSLFIIVFQIWSVYNSYDGNINTINGSIKVIDYSYKYPYFSDEWIGASLVDYSIKNHSLALVNPLNNNSFFANPLFPFFSITSYFFLLLNINPITNYYFITLLNSLLICLLLYFLLRINKVSVFSSIFSILCIPLITNGSNLPGIWFFLPFNFSILFLIISLISIEIKEKCLFFLSIFISLAIYPPIVVFILPLSLYYLILNRKELFLFFVQHIKKILFIFFLCLIGIFLSYKYLSNYNLFAYILRENLDGGIVSYYFWYILPIISIPLIILGIISSVKDRKYSIILTTSIGIIFWFFYFFTTKVLIIEHPRVIVITSILLMFFVGVGLDYFFKIVKVLDRKGVMKILSIICIIIFGIISYFYPVNNTWNKLILNIKNSGGTFLDFKPAPPVNQYLIDDDLILFKDMKGKRFITIPWKGLVIGATTGNIPLESKSSTITNTFLKYSIFVNSDCNKKETLSKQFKIDFVYSKEFSCPGFKLIGNSREKLFLYSYENNI